MEFVWMTIESSFLSTVGAILENESISGLSTGKPSGFRRGASNNSASDDMKDYSPEQLVNTVSVSSAYCRWWILLGLDKNWKLGN